LEPKLKEEVKPGRPSKNSAKLAEFKGVEAGGSREAYVATFFTSEISSKT